MASNTVTAALPRPTEKIAIVSFVLVFLCGMALGAVLMSVTGHSGLHGTQPPAGGFSMSLPEWKQKLDLSDQQTEQLRSILDDFSRYYDDVLADGNSRIMQILNPDQRKEFEQMLSEHKTRP